VAHPSRRPPPRAGGEGIWRLPIQPRWGHCCHRIPVLVAVAALALAIDRP
jgi:hypothetical protein